MYCYICRANATPSQNFCRACGTNLRSVPENVVNNLTQRLSFSRRLQIIAEAVTDALRSGIRSLSEQPTATLNDAHQTNRFRHWGLIAFWAGIAALLGIEAGVILMLGGIGLMAYAKGFFGRLEKPAGTPTAEVQPAPVGETNPTETSFRATVMGERIQNQS